MHSRWSLCLNHFYVLSSGKVLSQCFLNKNTKYLSRMTRVTTFSNYSSLSRCSPFPWNLQVRCIWLETSRGFWGFQTGRKVQYMYTYIHDHYFGDTNLSANKLSFIGKEIFLLPTNAGEVLSTFSTRLQAWALFWTKCLQWPRTCRNPAGLSGCSVAAVLLHTLPKATDGSAFWRMLKLFPVYSYKVTW